MLVKAGLPDWTSRHAGALLPGWVAWRSRSACGPLTGASSCGAACCCGADCGCGACFGSCFGAVCCAVATPARARDNARKRILINSSVRGPLYLLIDAFVFVLPELAGLDLGLPPRTVALAPLAPAVGERIVFPRLGVALALVAALALGALGPLR